MSMRDEETRVESCLGWGCMTVSIIAFFAIASWMAMKIIP